MMLARLFNIFIDYRRKSQAVRAMPIRLWVETSSICNLRCVMCPNKDISASKKGLMDFTLFQKIVDEAKYFIKDMYLHHRGEPLLNPALFDMITYARKAKIKTRFHTNGTLLDEVKTQKLLAAAPNLVSFSVDGFEKRSYESIRKGADFETTVENILRLARTRNAMKLKQPYIVVEKIRFRNPDPTEDQNKINACRKRFLDAGVNEVIEKDEYIWAEESAPEITGPRTYSICTFPWYSMVICADGTVTPCPQDFHAKMNMGNVNYTSLKEVWNGEAYRNLRHAFGHNIESLQLCRKCDRLQRKTVGGIPFQYAITFLIDQLIGYNKLRKLFGTSERNG